MIQYSGIGKDARGKSPFGYVFKSMMKAIADVRAYGNAKYEEGGEENWRVVPENEWYHALARHVSCMMDARFNSKSRESMVDAESGLLHAAHAAANLMFIIELLEEKGNSLSGKDLVTRAWEAADEAEK